MTFIIFNGKNRNNYPGYFPPYPYGYPRSPLMYRIGRFFKFLFAFGVLLLSMRLMYPVPFHNAVDFMFKIYQEVYTEYQGVADGTISYDQLAQDGFKFYMKHNLGILLEFF